MSLPRIAFVEWETKIPIWRYEGRPSYEYDLTKIVDATAFGANATAMKGDLIGLNTLFRAIGGKTGGGRNRLIEILNSYDVVFFATRFHWAETLDIAREVKAKTMLGFGMGLDQFRECMQMQGELHAIMELMDTVDIVTTYHEEHVLYLDVMTRKHVEYLPMCYPYSYVKDNFRKPREDQPRIVLPGTIWNGDTMGRRDDIGSCIIAHSVMAALHDVKDVKLQPMDRKMHTTVTHSAAEPISLLDHYKGLEFMNKTTVVPNLPWRDFLSFAAGATLSIHWDWCAGTGRVAAEMAALGVPHIGGNTDHARRFFPNLRLDDEMNLHDARELAIDIIENNDDEYNKIIGIADWWGKEIDYDNWNDWFLSIMDCHSKEI
jgi:hypothetical protein